MCNWFQNKSPIHTFAVDWETWHCNWAMPCYFNGASPTGSPRWGHCLRQHLACEGLYCQHSCETQLLLMLDELTWAYDQKHQVDIGILYFSRAFDTVPHRKLPKKLSHYGITGPTHSWIESLCNCHMWVTVEGTSSSNPELDTVVPQSTMLRPSSRLCNWFSLQRLVPWIDHSPPVTLVHFLEI